MSIFQKIRLAASAVLLCGIFLPLSQCTKHDSGDGASYTPAALAHSKHLFPQSDDNYTYEYAFQEISMGLRGLLTLLAFLWPLIFLIWRKRLHSSRFWWVSYVLELLLCAGSTYWVSALTMGGRWLYGAYVAEIAIALYACATLMLFVNRIRYRPVSEGLRL